MTVVRDSETVTDVQRDSQFQAVIDAMPDPAVAIDRAGIAVAGNAPARALVRALRLGQPIKPVLPAEVAAAVERAMGERSSQRVQFSEYAPLEHWYEVHVIPATDGLLLLTFHDLTPLYRVEQMRADFVANASHELRTPLAALSGFIETLQGPARDDAVARTKFLDIMQAQASRMARLIDDLLSLSRIELRASIAPDTPVDLVPIVRQVLEGLQTLAKEREVKTNLAAPTQVMVRGDRDELTRLFENLVENGLKYGASGKRVDVRIEAVHDGRDAVVSVRDYGPGIAPEHLPRLTERFYRVDAGQSRAEGGTGLGLALVKHILNRHRGRLVIDSKLGAGSSFIAHLPLA
jgi:two-component system phosphate regulon sensor histidine kinase PhoR